MTTLDIYKAPYGSLLLNTASVNRTVVVQGPSLSALPGSAAFAPINLQRTEAHSLTPDGIVELFQITLRTGAFLNLKANNSVTWQGTVYEACPIQLTNVSRGSDAQANRPSLTIANPDNILSPFIINGYLDRAYFSRKSVLYQDLLADNNVYDERIWVISRCTLLTNQLATFELRDVIDGPNYRCPVRLYLPPAFPFVTL